jgi:hypothetical protein
VGEKQLSRKPEIWMAASEVALFTVVERLLEALIRAERAVRDQCRRAEHAERAEAARSRPTRRWARMV